MHDIILNLAVIDPITGAALIGATVSLFNSIGGRKGQEDSNKQTFENQMKLNEQSNSIWKEQNQIAYNQSLNSMYEAPQLEARGKQAAGLSSIWNGQQAPIASVASANPSAGHADSRSIFQPLDPMLASNIELNAALADKAKADANKTNAEIPWIDNLNESIKTWYNTQSDARKQEIQLGYDTLDNNLKIADKHLEGVKYSADSQKEASEFATHMNQYVAELSNMTGIHIAKINAESAKTCAQYSLKAAQVNANAIVQASENSLTGVREGLSQNQNQWQANLFVGMSQAGFNKDDVTKMVAYLNTGNIEAFKEEFGAELAKSKAAQEVWKNTVSEAFVGKLESSKVKDYTGAYKDIADGLKDGSDVIRGWLDVIPNKAPSKIGFTK